MSAAPRVLCPGLQAHLLPVAQVGDDLEGLGQLAGLVAAQQLAHMLVQVCQLGVYLLRCWRIRPAWQTSRSGALSTGCCLPQWAQRQGQQALLAGPGHV